MSVDDLIDELGEMVEKAWSFPLSHGRISLDGSEIKQILEEMRTALPTEIRQAKAIVADRTQILASAKRESETIVSMAEERAKGLVAQDEITKMAQQKANDLVSQAQAKSREMRRAASDYADDLMKRADDDLAGILVELRKARQEIRSSQRNT